MAGEKSCRGRCYCRIVGSRFGDIGVVWSLSKKDAKIIRVALPRSRHNIKRRTGRLNPFSRDTCPTSVDRICRKIQEFLKGNRVNFTLHHFDTSQFYHFQKRVLLCEKKIPYGWVSTYGRLAKKIGAPKAARAVATALSRNPFPIVIPCHRAIRSDGSLGGFQGGAKLKRQLLELEGVRFNSQGKVIMDKVW